MADRYVLTYDIGTQSLRAALVNRAGEMIGIEQIRYEEPYESPEPGWAEKDPDFYYDVMCEASLALEKKYPSVFERVEAVALTCIRDVIVNVDEEGKPLRPSINYMDDRTAPGEPKLSNVSSLLFKALSLSDFIRLQYKKSPVNWIMSEQPEIWEKTDKLLLLSGYLTYRLTGVMTDAVACTVGHIPFDVKKRDWADSKSLTRPIFDVPAEKLPQLTESLQVMGRITRDCANDTGLNEGLPVYAVGADKAAESIGLGCVGKTMAAMSCGTMASVTCNTPDYLEPDQFIPPYPSIIPGWYCPEYQIYRGYWLISWFKKYFCEMEAIEASKQHVSVEEYLNRSLRTIPAGCDGLFLSPFFTPDVAQPYARGAFVGLADYHTKRHMYKAVVEGINFALLEGLRKMEKRGKFRFTEIRAGGGGSQSSEFCQIIADMFGIPVVRTENHEVSALGAAVTAFVALGEYKDFEEACAAMVHVKDRFEPDPEKHVTYEKLFQIYKKIYPSLKPIYAELEKAFPRS